VQGLVTAVDRNGMTPLHLASGNDAAEPVALLLSHGADPDAEGTVVPYRPLQVGTHPPILLLKCRYY
jgi:ankyrin repeat protein